MDVTGALAARALTTRSVVRAPIWPYRHGLGWLLGPRLLMLEHIGRRTGEVRYVCLEVVDRLAPERLVVVSGFGERAQWYRNLAARPGCWVSTGRYRHVPAEARLMSESESRTVLARYQHRHPRAWRHLARAMERALGHPVDGLPMVELRLSRPLAAAPTAPRP